MPEMNENRASSIEAAGQLLAGPADRTEQDFLGVREWRLRREALKEYQRTLEDFRRTGKIQEKTYEDYAHITNPPHLRAILFQAYADACDDIERWQKQEAEAQRRRESVAALEKPAAERPVQSARAQLEAMLAERPPRPERKPAPAEALPAAAPPPTLPLRGVPFTADAPGRIYDHEPQIPVVDITRPESTAQLAVSEALLNEMMGELHFLMKEVAFRSMCQAHVLEDRMRWMDAAMRLATTGAEVAKGVARLRHGPKIKETRQTLVVENKVNALSQGGGG